MVVWLSAPPEVLSERIGNGTARPLLVADASPRRLGEILDARRGDYTSAAHQVVEVDRLEVEEVADRIEAAWNAS